MDFAPPPGPPPPRAPEVPAGWKALWNEQYKEWFFVNIYTEKSQWEKPTQAVYEDGASPAGPPPGYVGGNPSAFTDQKSNPYETGHAAGSSSNEDEAYARRLQAEEDERARNQNRSAMNDYASTSLPQGASSYGQQGGYGQQQGGYGQQQGGYGQQLPPRQEKKGLFSKLGFGSSSKPSSSQQAYPQQSYGGYRPQQQQGYGGYPQQQYGGGYGAAPKKSGGMGAMGGAALGLGGGLVGGMLIADAVGDHQEHEQMEQQQAYDQGYDNGQDNDYGGGGDDFGGGDF